MTNNQQTNIPKEPTPVLVTKVATPIPPAEVRLRAELTDIMVSLMTLSLTTVQGRLQLHNWFKALSHEDQLRLYSQNLGLREAQRIANYGQTLAQSIPELMSQINLGDQN